MIISLGLVFAALVCFSHGGTKEVNLVTRLVEALREMREDMSRMKTLYENKLIETKIEMNKNVEKMEDEIEERVERLEDLAKIGTLRSCFDTG